VRRLLAHVAGAGFVATFVGAVMLWWVDPLVVVEGSVRAKVWTAGVFAVLWAGGFLHAFVWRFGFCLRVCPIGLYYRYVTSRPPVGIVFAEDPDPCIQCGACTKVCPVDLEPRDLGKPMPSRPGEDPVADERYGDAECLRCGDCVEACRMIFSIRKAQTPPLRFGFHAKEGRGTGETAPGAPAKLDG
jgi:polyferredoxin